MRSRWLKIVIPALLAGWLPAAEAQVQEEVFAEPSVFDLRLGAHARELATDKLTDFACGTNGGPPGLLIGGFTEFDRCRSETSGLREVYFRYDNEDEYIARARSQAYQAALFGGTTVYAIPVSASALFDDDGILQGIRIVSDQRVPVSERETAYTLGRFLKARYDVDESACQALPRLPGEAPVGGVFVKERCDTVAADGSRILVETHHYRRPGQAAMERGGVMATQGQFWSEVRLEVLRDPDPEADAMTLVRAQSLPDAMGERQALVARARSCAGCDLAGAQLKRADLANADLRGADLTGANFHGANLAGADLTGTDLEGANLNLADLSGAKLSGANLSLAMAYEGRFEGADLSRANLSGGFLGKARFTRANLTEANLFYADLRGARFSEATLERAELTQAWLEDAVFQRAHMDAVRLDGAVLVGAQMRGASLVGASLVDADLHRADLASTDLTNADFRLARMTAADLRDAITTGTVFD